MVFQFQYPVTRPFPFRYFTPSIVFAFFIVTILFSLFNTIVTGYDLRVSYSVNPNETVSTKLWYDKAVFKGIKKLSPSCEPKELIARQRFQTNKYGLVYTVNNLEPMRSTSNVATPSILYLNNPLEDCTINSIKVEMEMHSRTAQQVAWSRWGPSLFAAISCSITNDQGSLRFNITAEYELVPPNAVKQAYKLEETSWSKAAAQNMFQFLKSNNVLDPAMWWAESLMSYSWVIAAQQMEVWNNDLDTHAQKGTINFWRSDLAKNISSRSFFSADPYFLLDNSRIFYDPNALKDEFSTTSYNEMLIATDNLAKAFYSTISADLGIRNENILTSEAALQQATSNFSNVELIWVPAGPATDSYDALKHKIGKPNITPSILSTNYLCQIPVAKPLPSMVISVVLADLVFIRALWMLVTWAAVWIARRRDTRTDWCAGCVTGEPVLEPETGKGHIVTREQEFLLYGVEKGRGSLPVIR